jgi:hypothetical protein
VLCGWQLAAAGGVCLRHGVLSCSGVGILEEWRV